MANDDVSQLFYEKRVLEQRLTAIIAEFEEKYGHKIEIDEIKVDRMRIIGPHKALIKLTIKVVE